MSNFQNNIIDNTVEEVVNFDRSDYILPKNIQCKTNIKLLLVIALKEK